MSGHNNTQHTLRSNECDRYRHSVGGASARCASPLPAVAASIVVTHHRQTAHVTCAHGQLRPRRCACAARMARATKSTSAVSALLGRPAARHAQLESSCTAMRLRPLCCARGYFTRHFPTEAHLRSFILGPWSSERSPSTLAAPCSVSLALTVMFGGIATQAVAARRGASGRHCAEAVRRTMTERSVILQPSSSAHQTGPGGSLLIGRAPSPGCRALPSMHPSQLPAHW